MYDAIGAGTGFIGLTDRRAIIQDNSYFGKQVALISIPYRFITSVGFVSDKSFLGKWASTSKIAIVTSAKTHEVEFRGDGKARHVPESKSHAIKNLRAEAGRIGQPDAQRR